MKTKKSKLIKLYLLVITIPIGKKEIIGDILAKYDVTCFLSTLAKGSSEASLDKEIMFCAVKEDRIKDAMFEVEDKFSGFRSKVSMIYAIPFESIIGVSNYMALANGGKK